MPLSPDVGIEWIPISAAKLFQGPIRFLRACATRQENDTRMSCGELPGRANRPFSIWLRGHESARAIGPHWLEKTNKFPTVSTFLPLHKLCFHPGSNRDYSEPLASTELGASPN